MHCLLSSKKDKRVALAQLEHCWSKLNHINVPRTRAMPRCWTKRIVTMCGLLKRTQHCPEKSHVNFENLLQISHKLWFYGLRTRKAV